MEEGVGGVTGRGVGAETRREAAGRRRGYGRVREEGGRCAEGKRMRGVESGVRWGEVSGRWSVGGGWGWEEMGVGEWEVG